MPPWLADAGADDAGAGDVLGCIIIPRLCVFLHWERNGYFFMLQRSCGKDENLSAFWSMSYIYLSKISKLTLGCKLLRGKAAVRSNVCKMIDGNEPKYRVRRNRTDTVFEKSWLELMKSSEMRVSKTRGKNTCTGTRIFPQSSRIKYLVSPIKIGINLNCDCTTLFQFLFQLLEVQNELE